MNQRLRVVLLVTCGLFALGSVGVCAKADAAAPASSPTSTSAVAGLAAVSDAAFLASSAQSDPASPASSAQADAASPASSPTSTSAVAGLAAGSVSTAPVINAAPASGAGSGLGGGQAGTASGIGATRVVAEPDDPDEPDGSEVVTKVSGLSATPLVVVFDLSGSMTEDDGTGTIKLDGAKMALTSLMARQVAGTSIGLWTYPGVYRGSAQVECEPGYWVTGAALGDYVDPEYLSATINGLTANGGTPTGPALAAVGAELRDSEVGEAVILLVSDGLSNCGTPPCEVAEQLVADGFDITVQAMGFQIEQAGREELECVAAATNGAYYPVEDSEELGEKLDELGVAGLELVIHSPSAAVTAGTIATITAAVTNPSARDVADVTVSMVGVDADTRRTLFPAVIPPRYRLGNLPGGQTLTRQWELVVGTIDAGGLARLRITAGSPEVGSVSEEIEIRVVTLDGLSIEDAWIADIAERGEAVVILGDSYSSGEGAGNYVAGTDDAGNHCHRSFNTYVAQTLGDEYVDIIACSGAIVADYLNPSHDNLVVAQHVRLIVLQQDQPIGGVLLTMGGNDALFGDIVLACLIKDSCSYNLFWVRHFGSDWGIAGFSGVGCLRGRGVLGVVGAGGAPGWC
ncbi:MAG: VWA domain-containing protein [Bifidobacteriaceae bacterium]|jgi:hypothetical protein|nr:VWA domain-containing protein [Bifidobacteriaceae bacterium]